MSSIPYIDDGNYTIGKNASEIKENPLKQRVLDTVAVHLFKGAAYLTDPICKSHEYYRRVHIVDALNPKALPLVNLIRKVGLAVGLIGWSLAAVWTTLPGIALRFCAASLQDKPFIKISEQGVGDVVLPNKTFSLLSWNVCCVAGGYSISDGGVLPWSFRIDQIIDKIIEKNADVNCLYETFDTKAAFYIADKLKNHGYEHIYFNIGPKSIGVSSGILVASKYPVKNPEFFPFSQDDLVGRTQYAAKGFFMFDLGFAKVCTTHLQHSEEPQFPTEEEKHARIQQMKMIMSKINTLRDQCMILTGDLNFDDEESKNWIDSFDKDPEVGNGAKKTWGGDAFCANLVNKKPSASLNLDHTWGLKETLSSIHTELVDTGYDGATLIPGALSDHLGLFSRITIK